MRAEPLQGVWAMFVLSGGHRVIGCLDPRPTADAAAIVEALTTTDDYVQLAEAYELAIIPTPKGLAPVTYPYGMLPGAVPMLRTANIQTMAWFHQLDAKAKKAFEGYVTDARAQAAKVSAALSGLSIA